MKQDGLYDGRGLILGPNSPFKNNPHSWYDFVILHSEKQIIYTNKMEIDATDGKDGHIYRLKKIDEIQEILIVER